VSDTSMGTGKVVVNRSMSLDGFIAGPGDAMNWIFDFMGPVVLTHEPPDPPDPGITFLTGDIGEAVRK
jgi:hypothetical protein